MSAARLSEIFLIFVVLRTVLDKKCGSFYEERTDGQHSFIPFRLCGKGDTASPGSTYLSGVWSIGTVCFPQGLTTASYLTDGISSTLSFLLTARVRSCAGKR